MPIYSFRDTNTQEIFDRLMPYSEKIQFLEENPHIESIITSAPSIGDSVRLGLKKPDQGFRDVLRNIKSNKAYSNNKINDF
jgi:hypothetical protein